MEIAPIVPAIVMVLPVITAAVKDSVHVTVMVIVVTVVAIVMVIHVLV